jgi:hypothetical protein
MSSADDKLAIAEVLYGYATGVDTRNWTLYRALFADEVRIDFSSYSEGRAPQQMAADDWVAGLVPLFTGLAVTQHSMTNPLSMVDGQTAAITMYMQAHHVFDPTDPASYYTIGGYYDDTLVRSGDGWLLTGVRLTMTWQRGDRAIMEQARSAGTAALRAKPGA